MSTYKGIQGYTVQSLASDPTVTEAIGQLWYNSASNVWKVGSEAAGAWASGGTLGTARYAMAACGLQTAAIAMGGAVPFKSQTETYNGSTWTEVADMVSGRHNGLGTGTQTAALYAGGSAGPGTPESLCETWNGSAWSEGNNLNEGKIALQGAGITTAALSIGGSTNGPVPTYINSVETYNGTCWTEGTNLLQARGFGAAAGQGTTTASLYFGGIGPAPTSPVLNNTESYNGTSWTEVADLNTARENQAGAGTQICSVFWWKCRQLNRCNRSLGWNKLDKQH